MATRTWAWMAVLLIACSGGQDEAAAPEPQAGTPAAEAPPAAPSTGPEAEMLAKGEAPPPPGPNAQLLEKVAEHYGVGLARCPLMGSGRVRQIYGTGRDHLNIFGPTWEMEWDAAKAPPWDPVFDEVLAEDNWVTLLAVPGQTRAWVATRADTYAYEFPPAVAGQTVTCTAVHTTTPRVVRGKVTGEMAEENVVVPCLRDLPAVASDGTFVVEVPTPCEIWVEGGPNRSEKMRIDEGEGPLDAEFVMARDPLLKENRFWSDEGNAKVEATLAKVEARHKETSALLDKLAAAFPADDNLIQSNIKRHRYEMTTRDHKINLTRIGMEEVRQGKMPAMIPGQGMPAGH